ncbi:uncharacterized protein LOC131950961 isoform X3 [Physella acuta]|uniref:uncharacterized protein LOC131950961 isoform X1 n=1 Tax=Physella acuta TaxID=109671 RepID=UPI0027DBE70A|nr:uncharacterized protein LOC131950961 isoform X1 [Physella acuta]XP_059169173.1 uncharacterized protein LOC131950961 isoform X2 [Physella acuta]XP_059169174.1 uncharacterized protein LOC131950961 isoform X3 [Physella acuta]
MLTYNHQPSVLSHSEPSADLGNEVLNLDSRKDFKLLDIKDTKDTNANNKLKFLSENGEEEGDENPPDLRSDLAPPIVHVLWCGVKRFEFRHYLSIKRANFIIKPDKIIFHYQDLPVSDHEQYYTWFNKTLTENDHVLLKKINTTTCPESGAERYMLVLSILEYFGGIYVPEDAILVDFPVHLRAAQFVSGVYPKSLSEYLDGIIVAKRNGFISPSSQTGLNVVLASGRSKAQGTIEPCGSPHDYNTGQGEGNLICVKVTEEIFPADIWDADTNFALLCRVAGYGMKTIQRTFNSRTSIPKIGHYICWDCELKFSTYISVLSALNIAGLSKVYVHGIKQPTGLWWNKLLLTQRVIHVYREYPETSQDRSTMTQELAQAIMRVSILLKYGGVYCDSKVIWTNTIPEDYFSYDAVASPDWLSYGSWPDSISHTTIMAKKNSEYLFKLRNLHSQRHKERFWFVDQFLAYKILEENPDVLFLDRHFQVKCLNQNCHPTWQPDYKASFNDNPPGARFEWQNETLSVYWDVFPELELDTVKYTSGPVVDAARRALYRSGVTIQDLSSR